MRASFRLGRISGIPIGVHWSILVIFGLITWGLADVVLPQRQPGHPAAVYWVAAFTTSALFYLCLLGHELSHALVARRFGLDVRGITLWLFGGIAELGGDARSPEVELRVAVVGPVVSLVLAGLLAGMAAIADLSSAPALLVASMWWLSTINLTLGLFNLVPAYPLDGGRVLRAILWRRRGDQERATLGAASVGQIFAAGLITFGLLDLASGGQRGGLWLTGLGWFLHSAARSERLAVVVRRALGGIRVRDAMTPVALTGHLDPAEQPANSIAIAAADEPVIDVLDRMAERSAEGPILVVSDAQVVGILSTDDIARALESARQHRVRARDDRRSRRSGDRTRQAVTNG